jgi:hypothetical protein
MRLLRLPSPLRRHHAPPPGTRLRDRFELLVPLGTGGFGTVWEGFDMLLERPVAIKEIELQTSRADAYELALREARATARLNHPGIVSLYEVVQEDGRLHLVSELVDGCTLEDLIDQGTLSDRDCAVIGGALCEALAHAHAAGVVHRDVKPANVMVPRAWCEQVSGWRAQPAKLMDFGIATVLGATGAGDRLVAGSINYIAPEQAAGMPVDAMADVYSLAAVLYECFTGQPPAGRRRRDRLSARRCDLPPELTGAIDAALEEDPLARVPLDDLADALATAQPRLSDSLERPRLAGTLRTQLAGAMGELRDGRLERVVWSVTLAAMALLLNAALDAELAPLVAAAGAALGFTSPRHGPLVFVAGCTGALAGAGQPGAAALIAATAVPAALAMSDRLRRVALGAMAAWWLILCGTLSGTPLLLVVPEAAPQSDRIAGSYEAGAATVEALVNPATLATVALWGTAAWFWAWVMHGPRRLGMTTRISAWAGALAAAQLALGVALEPGLATATLAAALATLAAAAAAGFVQRRGGRVFLSDDSLAKG